MFMPNNYRKWDQAKANAKLTGTPWSVFYDTSGNVRVEPWSDGGSNYVEQRSKVYPDGTITEMVSNGLPGELTIWRRCWD